MTRLIYPFPIELETNGDCSEIRLNYEPEYKEVMETIKGKLKFMGFPVYEGQFTNPVSITFSVLVMKKDTDIPS